MDSSATIAITRMSRSSWFKLVYQNRILHLDPGYAGFFENQGTPSAELEERADYILISHPHKDHLREEIVDQLWHPPTIIIAPEACAKILRHPVAVLSAGSIRRYNDIIVEGIEAYNTTEGHSLRKYHEKGNFLGFLIDFGTSRLYFAGDTDFIPEMKQLGNVDIAFLPIGGTYVMDHEEALAAAVAINPRILVAMHQADTSMAEFKNKVESLTAIEVLTLEVGQKALLW